MPPLPPLPRVAALASSALGTIMATTANYEPLPTVAVRVQPRHSSEIGVVGIDELERCGASGAQQEEVIDLPTVRIFDWEPTTHVQLPSGKLLRCAAFALSTYSNVLNGRELADHTVALDYPASCDFQDEEVASFFDWLHKFDCVGAEFGSDEWNPKWFHIATALQCTMLYGAARKYLQHAFDYLEEAIDDESFWEWLSVSRHPFMEFGDERRRMLRGLEKPTLQLLLSGNFHRLVRCIPLEDWIDLAVEILSRFNWVTVRHAGQPDIELPSGPPGLTNELIGDSVEKTWSVSRDAFDWTSVPERVFSGDVVLRRARQHDLLAPKCCLITDTSPPPQLQAATKTVICDGVMAVPPVLRAVLVIGELRIVCRKDWLARLGGLIYEIAEACNYDRTEMAEIPLPGLMEVNETVVVEFFQRIHDKTWREEDASGWPVHWRPSWVSIVSYLQAELLFDFAAGYVWDMLCSGRCCDFLAMFCDCIKASRLQFVRSRSPDRQLETQTAVGLVNLLIQMPYCRFRRLLSESDRTELVSRFEEVFGEAAHVVMAKYVAVVNGETMRDVVAQDQDTFEADVGSDCSALCTNENALLQS